MWLLMKLLERPTQTPHGGDDLGPGKPMVGTRYDGQQRSHSRCGKYFVRWIGGGSGDLSPNRPKNIADIEKTKADTAVSRLTAKKIEADFLGKN
jgi:hypothetical protein